MPSSTWFPPGSSYSFSVLIPFSATTIDDLDDEDFILLMILRFFSMNKETTVHVYLLCQSLSDFY